MTRSLSSWCKQRNINTLALLLLYQCSRNLSNCIINKWPFFIPAHYRTTSHDATSLRFPEKLPLNGEGRRRSSQILFNQHQHFCMPDILSHKIFLNRNEALYKMPSEGDRNIKNQYFYEFQFKIGWCWL